jgi:uncharacterized protein YcaQ
MGRAPREEMTLKGPKRGAVSSMVVLRGEPERIDAEEARLLSLAAQRLDLVAKPSSPPDKSAILETIRALGAVQLDSISVVARSHETVLWSRLGEFDAKLVAELYHPDRRVAEYLAHAAAIVPVELMPYFRRRMASYKDPASELYAGWEPDVELNASVLGMIRERGPLPSRAFERPEGPRPAPWSWWGGKPAKKALDYLWTCGDLSVLKREAGFQRVYELTERLHPDFHAQDMPSEDEQRRFFIRRALSAMGIATAKWAADYFRTGGRAHVPLRETGEELAALEAAGQAIPVAIPNVPERAWMDPALVPLLDEIRADGVGATRTTLLSPFDSLIWFRQRTRALFDFDYRIECYTPAPKRRYGYYTLPILYRGQLVGRLDPSYDRKRQRLTVKAMHLEPGVAVTRELAADLAAALREYRAFLGGDEVDVLESDPVGLRAEVLRHL